MKKLVFIFLSIFLFLPNINAEEKYVNLYLFHSNTCPHCADEIEWFQSYLVGKDNVKLYKYEINENNNRTKFDEVKKIINDKSNGVPFLVIGEDVVVGFRSSSTPSRIETLINYYMENDYVDEVGKYLNVSVYEEELLINPEPVEPAEPIIDTNQNESLNNSQNYQVPVLGNISAKNVSLPILAIVLGFVDGFNPCALWILVFLITMLFNMQDRKKMWVLGLTFILTSGLVYLLFMVSWLNLAVFMNSISVIRVMISIFAIIFGSYNVYSFIKTKSDMTGCNVTNEKSRSKIMDRIRVITANKSFIFAILGIMFLAVSVNILELLCSLGLPVIFTQVLAINELSTFKYGLYILLYIIFFLIDDIVIFCIAMKTLKIKGISNKYTKYSHLIGGVVMLIIGLLMLIKPEWLMFNF